MNVERVALHLSTMNLDNSIVNRNADMHRYQIKAKYALAISLG